MNVQSLLRNHKTWAWVITVAAITIVTVQGIRLATYPSNPEVFRDYAISRHIALYDDRPLTGPYNSIFPALRNSPTYPYFWAPFVLVQDNLIFLTVVNVLLQALGLVFLFLLGRQLFGPAAASIGVILYALSWTFFSHTTEVWQVYTMQPILFLGLWLFVKSLYDKNRWLLAVGIGIITLAGTFHYAVFALLPLLIVIAMIRLWKIGFRSSGILIPPLAATIVGLLCYAPVFISMQKAGVPLSLSGSGDSVLVSSLTDYFKNFFDNCKKFLDAFFVPFGSKPLWRTVAAWVLLLVSVFSVIRTIFVDRKSKIFRIFLLGLFLVLQPLLFSAIFKAALWQYYFVPVFGIFALLIGYIIRYLFAESAAAWIIRSVIIAALVVVFSANFYIFTLEPTKAAALESDRIMINSIATSIDTYKREHALSDNTFFQFWVYPKGNPYRGHDAHFLTLLEKHYNDRFITLLDSGNGYQNENQGLLYFYVCDNFSVLEQPECINFISSNNPGFSQARLVVSSSRYSIYQALRQ